MDDKISSDPLLQPFRLKHLHLRNRVISTAHAPAYAEDGHPKDRYRLYHEEKAKGGLALTMIGGSTNVAPDSPSVFGQLYAGDDSIIPWFEKLTAGVKFHGAAVMCQITHMGRRTGWDTGDWLPVIGPSGRREQAHRSMPKTAEYMDLERIAWEFAEGARRCQDGGFDGIEILSHSHLLGQFLSPLVNDREDDYGGSLENRLRLTFEVLDAVRSKVGPDFVVGMRITGDELSTGGLTADECVEIAKRLAQSEQVDFLNILAGAPYDDLGLAGWVPPMGVPSARDLKVAGRIRSAVDLPIFHAGGINDLATARYALQEGMVDMIGMTRAHIADPYLVKKISIRQEDRIRSCVGLGYCVDRVNQGKDAVCGQNAVTGREGFLSHRLPQAAKKKTIVVVGGGPCGLETTRLAAAAGHNVHLFEASDRLGGQLALASKGTVRRQMESVLDWLVQEVTHSPATLYLSTYAEAEDIKALRPDLVVLATGGWPSEPDCPGGDLTVSSWDVLGGNVRVSGDVLLWDMLGDQPAAVTADYMSDHSAQLVFATPDTRPLTELGPTTQSVALKNLYEREVSFIPNTEVQRIERDGNRKAVTLLNTLTGATWRQVFDHVVFETGCKPMDDLYFDLVGQSSNAGQLDLRKFARGIVEFPSAHSDSGFALVRLGDAVASRNLHAALFDANRLVQGLQV
ncbi:NADH:flavin oxidoreductase [uncultured Roseobacter sp.]|uniref:NADH:flavin oxidoreductase n=1 Tax=uncultured Roseobacter sp. TaxID=114847 RepID=UPI00260208C1|nr:NADH:flavin oxidoreductase [uncultured Roseobacter sp.]